MARGNFNNDELTNYYSRIYASLENETLNDPYGHYILQRIKGGQKTVFNKTQSEIRNFDMSFLDTIESVYPAILKIMRDPKKSIRYDEEIVAVEKARKVNSQTVRHLSSHTHLIKEITKEGDVIPSKVLTTFAEEEIAIYENRFIKSLVKRIEMFLERRYEVMKVSLESFETERLNITNKFLMSGQEVTVNLDIAIKNDLTTNVETTKEQYNRLLNIREMVQGLKGTEFMRALAKARDVLPPIMKTNIILHNPDFKLCYGLWLYLDRVDGIATNIDIKEKAYKYSNIFDKDINEVMALALTAFIKNRGIDGIYSSKKLPQVKAPKPIRNDEMELELNLEADNKKLEDYTMNEVLLSQTAKFFEASFDGMQRTGGAYNESIRVVYRQMLDMLDQIYPKAFGISDEELESRDLYEQLEFARRRMMIFKIVRQQKQMNIARMGKEEKRIEKLILKLEDKIKVQERREREKLERQRAKEEAQRLAALEKQKKEEARKKRLEKEAIQKQKQAEKLAAEMKKAQQEQSAEKAEQKARMQSPAEAKRERLRALKAEEEKKKQEELQALNPEEAKQAIPVRRRDEYDDLSDDELEALMAQNELLDAEEQAEPEEKPQLEEKPKEKPKKKAKKAPKVEEPKKEEPKKTKKVNDKKDIEDMTDDELEALMASNNMFGGGDNFDLSDLNDNLPEDEVVEDTPVNESNDDAVEAAPVDESFDTDSIDDNTPAELEDLSDDELEALMAENGLSDDIPQAMEEPEVEEAAPEVEEEPEPEVEPEPAPAADDDFDDLSDDELEALLAENGML